MNPTITAFESSPDRGRGLARDMRVRWALEEVGQPYDVRLLSFAEMKAPAHLGLLPDDADGRARAIGWMFAALNTVEPPIVERSMATIVERDKGWCAARMPM